MVAFKDIKPNEFYLLSFPEPELKPFVLYLRKDGRYKPFSLPSGWSFMQLQKEIINFTCTEGLEFKNISPGEALSLRYKDVSETFGVMVADIDMQSPYISRIKHGGE